MTVCQNAALRRAHEFKHLIRHPVHVDSQGDAPVHHHAKAHLGAILNRIRHCEPPEIAYGQLRLSRTSDVRSLLLPNTSTSFSTLQPRMRFSPAPGLTCVRKRVP